MVAGLQQSECAVLAVGAECGGEVGCCLVDAAGAAFTWVDRVGQVGIAWVAGALDDARQDDDSGSAWVARGGELEWGVADVTSGVCCDVCGWVDELDDVAEVVAECWKSALEVGVRVVVAV